MGKRHTTQGQRRRKSTPRSFWYLMAAAIVLAGVMYAIAETRTADAPATYVSTYTPQVVEPREPVVAAYLGDSYTDTNAEGYAPTSARLMCWQYHGFGQHGTGYINPGSDGRVRYLDRVPDVIAAHPDVVVLQGSTNDIGKGGITSAATAVINAVRTGLPDAKIVMVGPVHPPIYTLGEVTAVRDQLAAAAADTGTPFIDPIDRGWLSDDRMFSSDRLHPSQGGHVELRKLVANAFREMPGMSACT